MTKPVTQPLGTGREAMLCHLPTNHPFIHSLLFPPTTTTPLSSTEGQVLQWLEAKPPSSSPLLSSSTSYSSRNRD